MSLALSLTPGKSRSVVGLDQKLVLLVSPLIMKAKSLAYIKFQMTEPVIKNVKSAVLYPAPESRKRHNSAQAVMNVPSVRQHIRCGTDRPSVVS